MTYYHPPSDHQIGIAAVAEIAILRCDFGVVTLTLMLAR